MRKIIFAIFTLLMTSAGADQSVRVMTSAETASTEARCNKDPVCAEQLKKIKADQQQYREEMTRLCAQDRAACEKRWQQDLTQQWLPVARCESAKNCVAELNQRMPVLEKEFTASAGCQQWPAFCEFQQKQWRQRESAKQTWCESYPGVCTQAVQQAQVVEQRQADQEKQRQEAEKAAAQQRQAAERAMIRQANHRVFKELAVCQATVNQCVHQINQRAEAAELALEKLYCDDQNRRDPVLCHEMQTSRLAREKNQRRWCDENETLCQAAVTQAAGEREALQKLQAKLNALCPTQPQACEQKRQHFYQGQLQGVATCEGRPQECLKEIDVKVSYQEHVLLNSIWCKDNQSFCNEQRQRRSQRLAAGKSWCDENPGPCQTAQHPAAAEKGTATQ